MNTPVPAYVRLRVEALREHAFELHEQLALLLREGDDVTSAAVGVQSVANRLGTIEAVMAPHRQLSAELVLRR